MSSSHYSWNALVDLTMHAGMETSSPASPPTEPASEATNVNDEERAFNGGSTSGHSKSSSATEETELQPRASSAAGSASGYVKKKTSQLLQAITPTSLPSDGPLAPRLQALVDAFASSTIATSLQEEIADVSASAHAAQNGSSQLPDAALETMISRGRRRASWGTQFRILSGRAFKNLYRDPALLAAHYISAVLVARACISRPSLEIF